MKVRTTLYASAMKHLNIYDKIHEYQWRDQGLTLEGGGVKFVKGEGGRKALKVLTVEV